MIKIIIFLVLILFTELISAQISYNRQSLEYNFSINPQGSRYSNHGNELLNGNLNNEFALATSIDSIARKSMCEPVKERKWLRASLLPAALISAGVLTVAVPDHTLFSKYTIQEQALKAFPGIDTPIDNYLQFVPAVAVFGLKAAGVRSRNDLLNQTIISMKAEFVMGTVVHAMKQLIRCERPDHIGMNTMPSGHTAQAFLSATILDMEYRDASPWISVGGYAVAATTAVGRVVNNRHWVSDVLVGAGIGIFSAKLVYLTHKNRWGNKSNTVFVPMISPKGAGAALAIQF